jgi:hypothetical protein
LDLILDTFAADPTSPEVNEPAAVLALRRTLARELAGLPEAD